MESEVLNSHPLKVNWRFPVSFLGTGSGWLGVHCQFTVGLGARCRIRSHLLKAGVLGVG